MSNNKLRSGKPPGSLALLTLTPIMAVLMASAPTSLSAATATYDSTLDKVVVSGSSKALAANSKISVYDTANQVLLYTINTNKTGKYNMTLPITGNGYVPCSVRLEMVNAANNAQTKTVLPVTDANANACAAAVACSISSPAKDTEITAGKSVTFAAATKIIKGQTPPTLLWKLGDGSEDQTTNKVTHVFDQVGRYRVTMSAVDASGNATCADDVIISVIPPANVNPGKKVAEQTKPALAAAMPKISKKGVITNDDGAYVVLPFEEMGMQGGSQIHLPYNAMINYNSLNAQVLKKEAHKPPILNGTDIEVTYSAASNDKDPLGKNSINSTSQNLFANGQVGANTDNATTVFNQTTQLPTDVKFLDGQDYNQAKIRKTEQWDRIHQPFAKAKGLPETGTAFAERQSSFTPAKPLEVPDEGIRGYVDSGEGTRKMPGIANPFIANDPQNFDFNSYQDAFVAQFIPATDIDDKGRTNPYPLMRVQAKLKDSGAPLATTDAVYTTASETRCRECHLPGGIAADEVVWRTPVNESELTDLTDPTKPGPATGAGSFDPGADATKSWPPAIHNRFDNKHPDAPLFTNLGVTLSSTEATSATNIKVDQNGLRTDRVKASRWAKFNTTTGKLEGDPTTGLPAQAFSATKPEGAGAEWRLQIQVKFADAGKYGDDSWVNQEKAALFNTLVMHDYMVLYGPTPASGKNWPAGYSTQVADNYADDVGKSRAQPMYFCSGHHQSALKADVGVTARAYQTNRSDYSRAFHAFHGKMQVYKENVTADASADGLVHKKGDLIRDERGHPKEYGGRGWDSQLNDDNGIPLKKTDGTFPTTSVKGTPTNTWDGTKFTVPTYDPAKNNWRPDLFPMETNAELMLPFGKKVPVEENCAKCHTGPTEKSFRDIHHTAGLKCDSCHADMLAVGNVFANEGFDSNLMGGGTFGIDHSDSLDPSDFRRPWLDEPNCGSCHIGDANMAKTDTHWFSAATLDQAWADGDKAGASIHPMNARFAVMPTLESRPEKATTGGVTSYVDQPLSGVLYRKSADVHGSGANGVLTCSTCHGGSHAIWPNQDPNANDNQTSKQLQGYDGNIAECSVCHVKDDFKTGLVATDGGDSNLGVGQGVRDGTVVSPANERAYLAGPHGMHPVGDESWYKHADDAASSANPVMVKKSEMNGGWHNDMAKKSGPDGEDQCAACHGDDHKGTRLSKTLTDRTLTNDKGKPVKVVKGQVIGCDLCHTVAKSFTGAPDPASPTGGWPPAQHHMPPMPQPISGGSTSGGGGHG